MNTKRLKIRLLSLLFLASVGICFLSCSPQKRIARIAEKYNLTYLDTITLYDTTIINGFDTCYIAAKADTINIHDTINNIDYQIIERNDTIFLHVAQKADTITEIKYIPTEKIVIEKQDKTKKYLIISFCVLAVMGATFLYFFNKLNKN